jgi:replicative DNA helicase
MQQDEKKVLNTLTAYGAGFQIKVLSSLLKHKEFLQTINDVISPEMFDNPSSQWIVSQILKCYYKYHSTPSLDYLQIEVKKIDNEVLKVSVVDQIKEAYKASNEDQEYVEQEFSNFCRNQQLKKALLTSVDLLGKGQYEDIRILVDQALKAGQDKNLGHEYDKDVETRYREEYRAAVATPWNHVNELLMGGLGAGDLGIIFGNPGGGKSWMLVNLGAEAVRQGKNVAHYTLELSADYTAKRYDSLFTGIDFQDLSKNRPAIEDAVSKLGGRLIVKEFPMGKTTPQSIENHIQKCKDLDFIPDVVIIDYVDLLSSRRKSADRKEEIDDVYTLIKGMARELKMPVWTVSQVNRAGAKDDVIEGDKAAGSYNKMMIADFAMSLSRKRQDKVNGTGRIHIMKNRFGADGMTYGSQINTHNGSIKIDKDEIAEDQLNFDSGSQQNGFANSGFNNNERSYLKNKFYELGL